MDQLIVFFRDEASPLELKGFASNLVRRGDADYDERTKTLTWHRYGEFSGPVVRNKVKAFWVVAYFGSKAVMDLDSLKFPLQLEMILRAEGNEDEEEMSLETYDIAVCNTTAEGTIAARALQRYRIDGVPDEVVHLVIVPDEEIGKKMVDHYGFDCYIVLRRSRDTTNDIDVFVPEFSE